MILVADIGNTQITLGLYDAGACAREWRISSDPRRTADEYAVVLAGILAQAGVEAPAVTASVLGSVVPVLSDTIGSALQRVTGRTAYHVTHESRMPIENGYERPAEVGIDRLANAVAGIERYGAPVIIVDLGTAVTVDVADAAKVYRGGAILPGVGLSAQALAQGTARLPLASVTAPGRAIGRTTVESIRSGIMLGIVGAVDRIVADIRAEMGAEAPAVATGGQAHLLIEASRLVQIEDARLTLDGLYRIGQLNGAIPAA